MGNIHFHSSIQHCLTLSGDFRVNYALKWVNSLASIWTRQIGVLAAASTVGDLKSSATPKNKSRVISETRRFVTVGTLKETRTNVEETEEMAETAPKYESISMDINEPRSNGPAFNGIPPVADIIFWSLEAVFFYFLYWQLKNFAYDT